MYFRKDRVKLHGKTNIEFRKQGDNHSADLPRIELLATARSNKFDQIIKNRLTAKIANPVSETKDYYKSTKKDFKEHAQISRPRFAHLEESVKRKPVWVGDSYLVYNHSAEEREVPTDGEQSAERKKEKMEKKEDLIKAKRDEHGTATQETQLIGMEQYAKETLEGKVDLKKVKELRRAIRRRYANRKNFQKIFTLWDEDGQGKVSVKNILSMIKKLGLSMNVDEARVLVASADEDLSGDLSLDEFMNLIFNDNEALNVNLGNLKVLSGDEQKMLLEGQDDQIDDFLKEQILRQRENRQMNQLALILKNKLPTLIQEFQKMDPLKQGQVNQEKFIEVIAKQQVSEKIVTDELVKRMYDQFKKDDHNTDYREFLKYLKEFHIQSDYQKVEEQKPTKPKPLLQLKNQQDEKITIIDCTKIDSYQLDQVRNKAKKVMRSLQRYLPEKQQFEETLLQNAEPYVQAKDLTRILDIYFADCGEKVSPRELSALLSILQYNKTQIPKEQIAYYFYEEDDQQFYERCSQAKKGPKPHHNASTTTLPEMNTQKSSFYDFQFGLSSLNPQLTPELGQVLAKVEQQIFRASARQYEVYTKFDVDKDGYVSKEDLQAKLSQYHILNESEMTLLTNYFDPENKGAVNFQEFYQKIHPSMTIANVVPSLYPAKERNENLKTKLKPLPKQFYRSAEEPFYQLKAATRFGATPAHKNTFNTVQRPPKDSALYQSEDDRFEKNARLRYLREEQMKQSCVYDKKLDRIRKHQEEIQERIENKYQLSLIKEENKNKTKGLAAWSYEQKAHMQNDWK